MNPFSAAIAFAIFGFAIAVAMVLSYAHFAKRVDILDPVVIFTGFLVLFVVPLPLRSIFSTAIEGDVTPHLKTLVPYMASSVWWTTAAYIVFAAAYWSAFGRAMAALLPHPPVLRGQRPMLAALSVALLALVLLIILGNGLSGLGHLILLGYASSEETFGHGYLAVGFPWLVVAVLFVFYMHAMHPSRRWLIYGLAGVLVLIGVFLIMGNRSMVMYLLMTVILFVHIRVHKISAKNLIVLAASGFLALNIYGYLRTSNYRSFSGFINNTTSAFSGVQQSGGLGESTYYTLTSGEFVVPFETMPQMLKSVGHEVPYEYGKTFAEAPDFFVPSVLFRDRPLPLTNWYMNSFYEDNTGLNEGRAFFFLSEGYLNYGPIGVLLVGGFWGVLLGALSRYQRNGGGNPGVDMIYCLSIAFIQRGIAGSFASILVGLPEQSISAVILGIGVASLGATWTWRSQIKTVEQP